jgi:hypothetical protein
MAEHFTWKLENGSDCGQSSMELNDRTNSNSFSSEINSRHYDWRFYQRCDF